jgi:hypothetical protein
MYARERHRSVCPSISLDLRVRVQVRMTYDPVKFPDGMGTLYKEDGACM